MLRLHALPLYPEQRTFEGQLTAAQRAAWRDAVHRSTGPGGATGPELRSVLPCAREAQRLVFDDRHHNVHLAHPDAVVQAVTGVIRVGFTAASR